MKSCELMKTFTKTIRREHENDKFNRFIDYIEFIKLGQKTGE